MRLVTIYLTAYFLLIAGAIAALWIGGALQEIPAFWIFLGLMVAVGLGVVVLALSARREEVTHE